MRKLNTLKNFISTILPYIFITILGFWKVRAFVNNLGNELYSVNQLFYQLLTYLSLAEAGIGLITNQIYFKLFAKDDKDGINRVYTASKRFFKIIGFAMLAIGFAISFGLKHITNNNLSLTYLQLVFMTFLIKNVLEYFMFAPRNVIQADQKSYKINGLINLIRILENLIEITLLYLKVDYLIILIPGIFIRIIINYIINKKVYKEYPWLKEVDNPDKSIFSNAKHFIVYRIANIIYNNIDILIISTYLEPIYVVIYSGYNYIIKTLSEILGMISQSIVASLGNAINKLKTEENKIVFEKLNCAYASLAMFCTICFTILIDKFIGIWIGADKQVELLGVILFSLSLYNLIYSKNLIGVVEIKGWFKQTRNISIAESIANLVLSLVFVRFWGIVGVLLATVISTALTSFIFYPTYVYKHQYDCRPVKYYVHYIIDLIFTGFVSIAGLYFVKQIEVTNFIMWAVIAVICAILTIAIVYIEKYITAKDFKLLLQDIKDLIKGIFNKEKNQIRKEEA